MAITKVSKTFISCSNHGSSAKFKNYMKWYNLKENKCPKCDKDFIDGLVTIPFDLYGKNNPKFIHPCGFQITQKRYSEIVNSQITRDLEQKREKEGALI